jgi:hypothetical protein
MHISSVVKYRAEMHVNKRKVITLQLSECAYYLQINAVKYMHLRLIAAKLFLQAEKDYESFQIKMSYQSSQ